MEGNNVTAKMGDMLSCEKEYKAVSDRDDNIWRFRQQLVARTTDMLNRLRFFQNYRARTARP